MKTSKITKITILALAIMMLNLVPTFAAQNTTPANTNEPTVQKSITKEYTFTTETKPFTYEPQKTIQENGYEYEYKNISYKENSASQPVKTTKSYTNLTSKSVPNTIEYNGQTLYLNGTPTYTSHTTPAQKSTRTITDTKTYNGVVPGTESSVIPSTVTKDGVTLKKDSQNYTTTSGSFSANGTLASYDHDMNVSGTNIQLTDSSPQQGDWQNDLRAYFNLPSDTQITSASWRASIQHQAGTNKNTRSITYGGTRTLYNYTVKYSGNKTVTNTAEKTTYSTTAEYISKDKIKYSVTATVTYDMTEASLKTLEEKKKEQDNASASESNGSTITPEEEEALKKEQEEIAKKAKEETEKALAAKKAKKQKIIIGSIVGGLLLLGGIILTIVLISKKKKNRPKDKHAKTDDLDSLFATAAAIRSNKNEAKKETEKERRAEQKKEEAQRAKEEKARKAAEEKEKRKLEKEKAYEEKKAANEKRKEQNNNKKSPFMKKLDQIKADISSDDE